MTPQDRQKIVKLLNLTTSSNDAEALLAIRKANEMLGKEGMIWSDYLEPRGNAGQRGEPWRPRPEPRPQDHPAFAGAMRVRRAMIEAMLVGLKARRMNGLLKLVISNIETDYRRKGDLSEIQLQHLMRLYEGK